MQGKEEQPLCVWLLGMASGLPDMDLATVPADSFRLVVALGVSDQLCQ